MSKSNPFSINLQYSNLKSRCPNADVNVYKNKLQYTDIFQPTPLSRNFKIIIEYELGAQPKIYVQNYILRELADSQKIPHIYDGDLLCTFHPPSNEWNKFKYLSIIIPWISNWLYFFEEWLFSKEWKGGGIHPVKNCIINPKERG